MKKVIINIPDDKFELLRFEAIYERKSVADILKERIFHKPFHKLVKGAYDQWMEKEFNSLTLKD